MDRYTASSPIFLTYEEKPTVEDFKKDLKKDHSAGWLAYEDNEPIGYILAGKASEVAYVVNDDRSINVKGAYTVNEHRRKGIGTTLLSKAVEWSRYKSYERMTVDF